MIEMMQEEIVQRRGFPNTSHEVRFIPGHTCSGCVGERIKVGKVRLHEHPRQAFFAAQMSRNRRQKIDEILVEKGASLFCDCESPC